MPDKQSFNQEIYRKILHIFYTTSIALFLWYFGKNTVLPWFISIAIILPLLDYGRHYIAILNRIFVYFFDLFTRTIEYRILTGASWVAIGTALTTLIFNEQAAIIGLLVLSISDSFAALIGIKFGKTKLFNKSLEGSAIFFLSASFIIFLLSPALFIINLCAIFSATCVELFSTPRFNDNLFIPISIALILSIGELV